MLVLLLWENWLNLHIKVLHLFTSINSFSLHLILLGLRQGSVNRKISRRGENCWLAERGLSGCRALTRHSESNNQRLAARGIKIRKWRVLVRDVHCYRNGISGIIDLDMRARRESLASDWWPRRIRRRDKPALAQN